MAELIVDDEDLVVHLTLGEKIWGFHGDIRVRLASIVSVAPDHKPWLGLRGWRMAGVAFAGHAALGTRRHGDGYDFCILHRDRPAVRVDVASGRFSRLVICVPEGGDPETEAARIAAAAGITPSPPPSSGRGWSDPPSDTFLCAFRHLTGRHCGELSPAGLSCRTRPTTRRCGRPRWHASRR